MDESRPCTFLYPEGLLLQGRCGTPSLAGTDRCPFHTERANLPEVYRAPVSLLESVADAMATSPDTTDDEAAASPDSENTLAESEEEPEIPTIPAEDADPDLGPDDEFHPDGTGEPCYICLGPLGQYRAPEDPAETTTIIEVPIRTPCNHLFGRLCLYTWLATNDSCPLCRLPLDLSILVPPYSYTSDCNNFSYDLADVVGRHSNGDARPIGIIYGIDPSAGFFEMDYQVVRVPAGRHVATVLDALDGRRQLRIDDEAMKTKALWWDTSDVRRPADPENARRVVTNLEDDSQCWEIVSGRTYVRTAGKRLTVPPGAKFIVLTRNGKFLRWAKSYEDWVKGF